jgi:hypothetical protein
MTMCDHTLLKCDHTRSAKRDHTINIEWVEKYPDLRPGVFYFDCERLSACITRDTCRQNWEASRGKIDADAPIRLEKCRGCKIGQHLHSDIDAPAAWMDFRSNSQCVRCGRHDLRIISTTGTCVSCWNRHRETVIGCDARGNKPKTLMTLTPRRVGILDAEGKPAWMRFASLHDGEAISLVIRKVDGAKFHDEQPAQSVWNSRTKRWQYRCEKHPAEFGTLRELVADDGSIRYVCPVCKPGLAKGHPEATVTGATSIQDAEFVKEIMRPVSSTMREQWTPTAHICNQCRHYPIESRCRDGVVECRCPLCDA